MNNRTSQWIPQKLWRNIVINMPIVSIDLVVKTNRGILLGKRANKPAKGKLFVPGGRLKKNECITDAVHRIAETEIDIDVEIIKNIGVYEHFYDMSDIDDSVSKHYIAHAFIVESNNQNFNKDFQHDEFKFYPKVNNNNIHDYTKEYIKVGENIGLI